MKELEKLLADYSYLIGCKVSLRLDSDGTAHLHVLGDDGWKTGWSSYEDALEYLRGQVCR